MGAGEWLREEARRKEELAAELRREAEWVDADVVLGAVLSWAWEGRAAGQVDDAVGARMRAIEDGVEDLREIVWRLGLQAADLHEEARWL